MGFRIVIPARLHSTRLPEKVLADVAGRPLIAHVCAAAVAAGADEVLVATDHPRIVQACEAIGVRALLTRPDHASGTDRIAEVAERLGWPDDLPVVNLQGDEPLMPPALLRRTAQALIEDHEAGIATLAHPIRDVAEWLDPNAVKVVVDGQARALYFSRAPIPWDRTLDPVRPQRLPAAGALRHVGLYVYRVGVLRRLAGLPVAPTERSESLEQLRALHAGIRIRVEVADEAPPRGVDTAEDLERLQARLAARPAPGTS